MQGLILFCALGGELLVRYRLRFDAPRAHGGGGRVILAAGGINNSVLVVVLASAVVYGTPLLYAALGELLAERSGVLNLGVEGMMLVGAVMGFWAVQRTGVAARSRSSSPRVAGARDGADPRVPRRSRCARTRSCPGLALTIFAGAAGLSSYLGNDLNLADQPARHSFDAVPAALLADGARRRADLLRAVGARLRVVGLRRCSSRCTSTARGPGSTCARSASRPRRPTRWGSTSTRVPLRAHDRRRRVRRRRRRVLLARDHAAVGRRAHGRRRLDRDRARHLRVLAADALPRRRLLLRRVLRHPVHVPGARAS